MAKKEMKEMSFMDHLEDLRWLLVRSTSAIIILACGALALWHQSIKNERIVACLHGGFGCDELQLK